MKKEYLDQEEEFHPKNKRESRKERKILAKKDRSKFKKTDREKKTIAAPPTLPKGRVLAILADGILVNFEHQTYSCKLKGNLKKETKKIKNLVAVGDFVRFHPIEGTIYHIEERYSILSRAEQVSRQKQQLIAVNIDQVMITVSIGIPSLKPNLIDRFIIAALKGNMDPVIVVNKIDLLEQYPEQRSCLKELSRIYPSLGIPFLEVSTLNGVGLEQLKEKMRGKSSVFSGQSGTGKTSLINMILGSNYPTGEVILKTKKGAHTTTNTRLLPILDGEGFCVDTPGIQSFGMWELKKEEIRDFFFEIAEKGKECRFLDCTHLLEPNCAVKRAVKEGEISSLRFESYCALISSLNEEPKR